MQQPVHLLGIVLAVAACGACSYERVVAADAERILFVGNSLTYYNDLPAMVSALYAAVDESRRVESQMLAAAGISLSDHLHGGSLESILAESHYDVVILQDIGGWPLCAPDFTGCDGTEESLAKAVELVESFGARPIWYSTYQPHPNAQQALSREAERIASQLNVELADVGAAMLAYRAVHGSTDVLLPDGHPATIGSWIAAATIVRSIADRQLPEGMVLDSVCRVPWQGSGLDAERLASEQQGPPEVCHRLEPRVLRDVVVAANSGPGGM